MSVLLARFAIGVHLPKKDSGNVCGLISLKKRVEAPYMLWLLLCACTNNVSFVAVASLATLQNLQNLASLHQTLPQVATLAASLSSMANLHTVQSSNNPNIVNGPLNLSVNAASGKSKVSHSKILFMVNKTRKIMKMFGSQTGYFIKVMVWIM